MVNRLGGRSFLECLPARKKNVAELGLKTDFEPIINIGNLN